MTNRKFRIWFSVACILLILLQSVSFIVFFTKQEENPYSGQVETVGGLRKLSQEMIKNVVILRYTHNQRYLDLVKGNIQEFDTKLQLVGSNHNFNYYIGNSARVRFIDNYERLEANWTEIKTVVKDALDHETPDGLDFLLAYQWRLTANIQSLVDLLVDLDKESQHNIARIQMVIVLLITVGITGIWFFLQHYLVNSSQKSSEEQHKLLLDTVKSLCKALDANDTYTYGHSERVAYLSRGIAEQMGCDLRKCFIVELSGYLHDIGKLGIPKDIIEKKGRLTEEEFRMIQLHPILGAKIVAEVAMLEEVVEGVLYHHERFDGSGYPYRLKGEDIPEMARILAVADAYDAMTSNRSYRQAMTHNSAVQIIMENRGTQFDSKVVDTFVKIAHHFHTIKLINTESTQDALEGAI